MNIKKIIGFFAVFAFLLSFASYSYADKDGNRQNNQDRDREENHSVNNDGHDQKLKLDWKSELTAKQCNAVGRPIVDVEQKVINDADSGNGGYWAMDKYKRSIKVYNTATEGTYCATVAYDGNFVSFAGASPNNTGTIPAGIKGEMEGGYRSTPFTGTLLLSPLWPLHGNVGTTDYNCDNLGNCPGIVNWRDKYFVSTSGFDLAWWGWIYKAGNHGTWINAISGAAGDIL